MATGKNRRRLVFALSHTWLRNSLDAATLRRDARRECSYCSGLCVCSFRLALRLRKTNRHALVSDCAPIPIKTQITKSRADCMKQGADDVRLELFATAWNHFSSLL